MDRNILDDVMKLPSEEKLRLYYALQEELEENNLLQQDIQEINTRLSEIESGKVKSISEEEHINFINRFGKDV